MSKYTPGPWRVDPNAPRYLLAGRGGISIGLASTVDVSDGMARANAHLIAAAPELLEALKELANHQPRDLCACRWCLLIAKAEGTTTKEKK